MIALLRLPNSHRCSAMPACSGDGRKPVDRMFALAVDRPVAACAGIVAMLCLAAYPLARGSGDGY
jgi:hypothetical protein